MKNRILNILLWSVISAAFIGPGTITTAASAGAQFGYSLIWALVFSTIACIVLQEASARLTMASGYNLGETLRKHFSSLPFGSAIVYLILFSILLGCAAYETGNILGAIAGITLVWDIHAVWLVLAIGGAAGLLLWFGTARTLARFLGILVAFMGLCFLSTVFYLGPSLTELLKSSLIPQFPPHSEILILGLIGTTVVPYNLFLGSGLKHSQSINEMRASLSIAIILGGIISIGVLIVGSAITGSFTYSSLAAQLTDQLGEWASYLFGLGLFAAGLSSAMTAPIAAVLTARSMLSDDETNKHWRSNGLYYRITWILILSVGIIFGLTQTQPIPAIILAQALNGIILPLVAIFLFLMMNNQQFLSKESLNGLFLNIIMGIVVFTTLLIGLTNLAKVLSRLVSPDLVQNHFILAGSIILSLLLSWPIGRKFKQLRQ